MNAEKREWKSGDVALVTGPIHFLTIGKDREVIPALCRRGEDGVWHALGIPGRGFTDREVVEIKAPPVAVIDPEDREQVERFREIASRLADWVDYDADPNAYTDAMQAALREFANPTPSEPTDPTARVTDRRDNIWRLLADGEWVCTSGPDCGEYLAWSGLVGRGPLGVDIP